MKVEINIDRVKELLRFDPETGFFYWKNPMGRARARKDGRAGNVAQNGYEVIRIDGKLILSHRLAFALSAGRVPEANVDHINGNPLDNRSENLREATQQQNIWNSRARKAKQVPVKGVWRIPTGYRAGICINGKTKHLGVFQSAEEAGAAYSSEAHRLRGEFARS